MPQGNKTQMTDEERVILGAWVEQRQSGIRKREAALKYTTIGTH